MAVSAWRTSAATWSVRSWPAVVVGGVGGDADARLDPDADPVQVERLLQRGRDALRDTGAAVAAARDQQHRELVAAEPRDRVAGAHHGGEPLGQLDQQLVPEVVPERVVDLLELVQVQHQDDRLGARARRRGEGLPGPVHEQGAVGQPGERVVHRLLLDRPSVPALHHSQQAEREQRDREDRGRAQPQDLPLTGHCGEVTGGVGGVPVLQPLQRRLDLLGEGGHLRVVEAAGVVDPVPDRERERPAGQRLVLRLPPQEGGQRGLLVVRLRRRRPLQHLERVVEPAGDRLVLVPQSGRLGEQVGPERVRLRDRVVARLLVQVGRADRGLGGLRGAVQLEAGGQGGRADGEQGQPEDHARSTARCVRPQPRADASHHPRAPRSRCPTPSRAGANRPSLVSRRAPPGT